MHLGQCPGSLSTPPHSHQSSDWQKERQLSALLCLTSCTAEQCRNLRATRDASNAAAEKAFDQSHSISKSDGFQFIALFQLRKNRVDPLVRKTNKQKREREGNSLFLLWRRTAGWPVGVWLQVTTDSVGDRWFAHIKTIRTRGQALGFQSRHETSWHSVCGACVKPWFQSTALWSNVCSNTANR